MSSKRAMKQAQKQAFAKHRSNILIINLIIKRRNLNKKKRKKIKFYSFSFFSVKNNPIRSKAVQPRPIRPLIMLVSALHKSKKRLLILNPKHK